MGRVLIRNAGRRPEKDTGKVTEFMTAKAADGRIYPLAVEEDSEWATRTPSRTWGPTEPIPPGMVTVAWPPEKS